MSPPLHYSRGLSRLVVALGISLSALGCAGHSSRTEGARDALDANRPKQALALLNEELEVDSAKQQPDDLSGDNALLLLDRSMVLQQLGKYSLSSADLQAADKAVDLLDLSRGTADDIGKYLFSDDTGPYKAPPYEKLLINTMNMVNYLVRHDLNGARVEARRLAVMQQYLKEHEGQGAALTGPGSYLAGFTFEKSGRADEALRYYDEALQYGNYKSLYPVVRRVAAEGSYRSPRIRKILETAPQTYNGAPPRQDDRQPRPVPSPYFAVEVDQGAKPDSPPPQDPDQSTSSQDVDAGEQADAGAKPETALRPETPLKKLPKPTEILVVINYGRVPAKVAKRIPIGLALTWAAGHMGPGQEAQANRLAAQGLVTWINYPALGKARGQYEVPEFSIDGEPAPLEAAIGIDLEARAAWKDAEGAVIGAAITRMISRVVAGEVARTAAGRDNIWGILLSLGTQATLTAVDTPDTRSWALLPARMAIGRRVVRPGVHHVTLGARGNYKAAKLTLKEGGWAVLNLTVLN
ncbi:MAG: hypothetical protein H6718_28435 [Polyangiaceae bacterium]|nr:hypothetical protein [Myxococcales bacterium]MCB9589375.1 hypothetical protein [Polyangiaceae bacterium]